MTNAPSGRRRRLLRPRHLDSLSIGGLRAIDEQARLNLKRAVPAVLLALACFAFGDHLGGIDQTHPARFSVGGYSMLLSTDQASLVVVGLCLLFLAAGAVATRSVANELNRVTTVRGGVAAGSAIRLICTIIGYGTVLLGVLALLRVDLGNLLVGGAVTGVVIGIAAQQTLGNFFAGLVLLFARPFVPGQRVKIRTGSLGGPFEGVILGSGLVYTTIETAEGVIALPNAGVLAAAIGPIPEPDEAASAPEEPATATEEPAALSDFDG
ncbi:MAG TPA: mechanosensitive ion channel family protein [Jatrophihabitans sp.]|nr:mechanosensitive ion channel family protein [Jatrophihabitans sp.]